MNIYIARETLGWNSGVEGSDIDRVVDLMTEILEEQGHEVEVGELGRPHESEEEHDLAQAAWEKAMTLTQTGV